MIKNRAPWWVVDAWLAIPPCTHKSEPYCHVDCPYFYECNPPTEEEEEQW